MITVITDNGIFNVAFKESVYLKADVDMNKAETTSEVSVYADDELAVFVMAKTFRYPPTDDLLPRIESFGENFNRLKDELAQAVLEKRPADLRTSKTVANEGGE